ncbi:hypothetical protein SAMN05192551_105170 [Tindallia magadiensis]|uniref:Uncharacterized protein n=1 Tax=Tindallia magadiensis TaxID=69895 RepID=A0A1I3EU47_9FIRM|nr:hypothetical protein [Tindallia magadiensis]SFI02400.1 hypothetical protein SAMN05192551_105170 [Tindallia magadiensis]
MNQRSQTHRILSHLSGGIGGLHHPKTTIQKPSYQDQSQLSSRVLVTFTANPQPAAKTQQILDSWKKEGCRFDVAFSSNAEALSNTKEILKKIQPVRTLSRNITELKDYPMDDLSAVLSLNMTHNTASKLTLGIQDGLIPILLWHALWKGIPVYMDFSALKSYHGEPTVNPMLAQMTEDTIQKLKKMGIAALETYQKKQENRILLPGKPVDSKVLTEKDILAMAPGTTIEIPAKTIVTALAKDTAKARSINVLRVNEAQVRSE